MCFLLFQAHISGLSGNRHKPCPLKRGPEILPYLSYLHVYYWDGSGRRPFEDGLDHWRKYFSILDEEKKYYALLEFVLGDSEEQFEKDAATLLEMLQKGV